jgi:peptidyl-tRNA hydrolase
MSGPQQIVQYIVVRSDLIKTLSWPLGALIAQTCHASTAVMHEFYDHEHTQSYLRELDRMHKVVLEVKDEEELSKLKDRLDVESIDHKLWIEQPENFPTCLAVRPYPKNEVQKFFKGLKLYKN